MKFFKLREPFYVGKKVRKICVTSKKLIDLHRLEDVISLPVAIYRNSYFDECFELMVSESAESLQGCQTSHNLLSILSKNQTQSTKNGRKAMVQQSTGQTNVSKHRLVLVVLW